jgi:uncharacterized protein YbdZ (MbtH family)
VARKANVPAPPEGQTSRPQRPKRKAQFRSQCFRCEEMIDVGQAISLWPEGWRHVSCRDLRAATLEDLEARHRDFPPAPLFEALKIRHRELIKDLSE